MRKLLIPALLILLLPIVVLAQPSSSAIVKDLYTKTETYITMRDGKKLFTSIYQPKDTSEQYPFLMERTPYGAEPYGADTYPYSLGPNASLMREKYIFVYQDVRGRYMSEGDFEEMTPHKAEKKSAKETDESSDTWDTIEWLLKNIKNNNGRVGLYGISYPGFYATASLPGAHPAIRAVSPQAPVTDEFIGDDVHHKGAFFLMDNFSFMNYFDKKRNGPVKDYGSEIFNHSTNNVYDFFLRLGTVGNANKSEYFNNKAQVWNEITTHDTYDEYWKARNIRTHLKGIKPAVLVVGGWYDAEDLFGALETYRSIESNNPQANNRLVMGPWTHGAWSSPNWSRYAGVNFNQNTSRYYQDSIETPFFNYNLKDKGTVNQAEAQVFETGSNQWKSYRQWPPENMVPTHFFFQNNSGLDTIKPVVKNSHTMYTSDPDNPVPYTGKTSGHRNNEYMGEDQQFLSSRKDLVNFKGEMLMNDLAMAGPVSAELSVSITGTDADFIVKVIDVEPSAVPGGKEIHRLVRAEVIRGKFRNDFSKPQAFVPGKIEKVFFQIPDLAHVFKQGHRIMIQVQSTWFPLVDRNPQKFMRIPEAKLTDFKAEQIRIFHDAEHASSVVLPVLK